MCPEKDALLQDRMRATNAYAEAVTAMFQNSQAGELKADYGSFYWAADQALMDAEQVRLAYDRHIARHHC